MPSEAQLLDVPGRTVLLIKRTSAGSAAQQPRNHDLLESLEDTIIANAQEGTLCSRIRDDRLFVTRAISSFKAYNKGSKDNLQ
jgi:hypothetical protein